MENHGTFIWLLLSPTWLWAPHTFFLDSFEEFGHLFDRCPQLGLVSCFLTIKLRLWVFGRKTFGDKVPVPTRAPEIHSISRPRCC